MDNDTLLLIIEQFLLLILIAGRWMMPLVSPSAVTVSVTVGVTVAVATVTITVPSPLAVTVTVTVGVTVSVATVTINVTVTVTVTVTVPNTVTITMLPTSDVLPQGEMTRDELAQLLLCYIGTAADIIEFFDSFKVLLGGAQTKGKKKLKFTGRESEHRQGSLSVRPDHLVDVPHAVHHRHPVLQRKAIVFQCISSQIYSTPLSVEAHRSGSHRLRPGQGDLL